MTVPGRTAPASVALSGYPVHKPVKRRLSERYPRRSWLCVTVEAHPLPFKHQDYTLLPVSAAPHAALRDAATPLLRRRPSCTESKPLAAFLFHGCSPYFRAQLRFFKGRYGLDSCGFCGRTRSSHIFRLDDGARRARVEMGVVFWRGLAFSIGIGCTGLQLP